MENGPNRGARKGRSEEREWERTGEWDGGDREGALRGPSEVCSRHFSPHRWQAKNVKPRLARRRFQGFGWVQSSTRSQSEGPLPATPWGERQPKRPSDEEKENEVDEVEWSLRPPSGYEPREGGGGGVAWRTCKWMGPAGSTLVVVGVGFRDEAGERVPGGGTEALTSGGGAGGGSGRTLGRPG
jgi:hypothetical protein